MKDEYFIEIEGMRLLLDYEPAKEINDEAAKRADKYAMLSSEIKAIREQTGMNRKDFAKWLGIPYRTMSDWEHGFRLMPDYVLRLIAYKVRMEFVEKRGDKYDFA